MGTRLSGGRCCHNERSVSKKPTCLSLFFESLKPFSLQFVKAMEWGLWTIGAFETFIKRAKIICDSWSSKGGLFVSDSWHCQKWGQSQTIGQHRWLFEDFDSLEIWKVIKNICTKYPQTLRKKERYEKKRKFKEGSPVIRIEWEYV